MKIFAINSSPNKKGSTSKLVDALLHECTNRGAICERVDLVDYSIDCCEKCCMCYTNGKCYKNDDFVQLLAKILESDGLIIASPYYYSEISPYLKTFIARLKSSTIYSRAPISKHTIGVSTSAIDNCKKVAKKCASLESRLFSRVPIISGLIHQTSECISQENQYYFQQANKIEIQQVVLKFLMDISHNHVPFLHKLAVVLVFKRITYFVVAIRKLNSYLFKSP